MAVLVTISVVMPPAELCINSIHFYVTFTSFISEIQITMLYE